jgi:hypothetical protein
MVAHTCCPGVNRRIAVPASPLKMQDPIREITKSKKQNKTKNPKTTTIKKTCMI